jgi:hypothetical protein
VVSFVGRGRAERTITLQQVRARRALDSRQRAEAPSGEAPTRR